MSVLPPLRHGKFLRLVSRVHSRVTEYAIRARYLFESMWGHREFIPFMVLTRSRSGSNLLLSFLNSHPNVYAEGEVFAKLGPHTHDTRLRRIFWKQPKRIKAKGFKIFYYHPLDRESPDLWQALEAKTDLRIIHLTRENTLRTLVSRKIAEKQNLWTGTRFDADESPDSKAVRFAPAELAEGFQQTRNWIDAANRRFRNHEVLEITYEALVGATDLTFRKVLDHLNLDYTAPCSTLMKQNPESLSALIENYSELREYFSGTEWGRYFTD